MDEHGQFQQVTPGAMDEISAYIAANRSEPTPYDIVIEGETPGDKSSKDQEIVRPWEEVGATWWIETRWEVPRNAEGQAVALERIRRGPPR
jgi:hypothetical protein